MNAFQRGAGEIIISLPYKNKFLSIKMEDRIAVIQSQFLQGVPIAKIDFDVSVLDWLLTLVDITKLLFHLFTFLGHLQKFRLGFARKIINVNCSS